MDEFDIYIESVRALFGFVLITVAFTLRAGDVGTWFGYIEVATMLAALGGGMLVYFHPNMVNTAAADEHVDELLNHLKEDQLVQSHFGHESDNDHRPRCGMTIREHMTQHEQAARHPLITDEATVTAIDPMDHNRVSEVQAAVIDLLESYEKDNWLDQVIIHRDTEKTEPDIDWNRLQTLIKSDPSSGSLAETITTLRDRYERPYPSLFRIRFAPDTSVEFSPGQYVTVRYQEVPRPYSISNPPTEAGIEICVRRVPGGRLTSELAVDLSTGDEVVLRGPYGDLLLEPPSPRDMVFLATGTGVAPIKSMIEYTFAEDRDIVDGDRREVWLFLGTGWRDDLPYRDRFRELAADHDNFHFVPTLSRESALTDWAGETAYVQYTFCKYLENQVKESATLPERVSSYVDREPNTDVDARIDPAGAEVYTVGVGAMVRRLLDVIGLVGVNESHVHAESYG